MEDDRWVRQCFIRKLCMKPESLEGRTAALPHDALKPCSSDGSQRALAGRVLRPGHQELHPACHGDHDMFTPSVSPAHMDPLWNDWCLLWWPKSLGSPPDGVRLCPVRLGPEQSQATPVATPRLRCQSHPPRLCRSGSESVMEWVDGGCAALSLGNSGDTSSSCPTRGLVRALPPPPALPPPSPPTTTAEVQTDFGEKPPTTTEQKPPPTTEEVQTQTVDTSNEKPPTTTEEVQPPPSPPTTSEVRRTVATSNKMPLPSPPPPRAEVQTDFREKPPPSPPTSEVQADVREMIEPALPSPVTPPMVAPTMVPLPSPPTTAVQTDFREKPPPSPPTTSQAESARALPSPAIQPMVTPTMVPPPTQFQKILDECRDNRQLCRR